MNKEIEDFINSVIDKKHVMESGTIEIRNRLTGFDEMWSYKVRRVKK